MAADPGGAAVGSGVARCARQGVQHHYSVKGDCHELVSEEEPGEVIDPLADKGCVLQASRFLQQPPFMHSVVTKLVHQNVQMHQLRPSLKSTLLRAMLLYISLVYLTCN